jgi:hypothetical protein
VNARVPLELVPVGARVRVWNRAGGELDLPRGVVARQDESGTFVNCMETHYRHGRWLAEVIDAPAAQQPRGEEVDPRDAEIGRLRDALWKYGQHLYACTSSSCRCGLADALKEQP